MLLARSALSRGQGALAAGLRLRSTVAAAVTENDSDVSYDKAEWENAKPYDQVPGPKPLPLLGNTWRMLPVIGTYKTRNILDLQTSLHREFGDIVRLTKVFGLYESVFVFQPEYAEQVFRNEGRWPNRRTIETLHYYRTVLRKDRYKSLSGTVTSQGEEWASFRSKVNQPLMKPSSAFAYSEQISEVSQDFIKRMKDLRDSNLELPKDFINYLYKWSLESIALVALNTRLGCLHPNLSADSEPQKMIDAVQDMLDCIYKLEFLPSLWRQVSTPNWRRMVRALDLFSDIADKYIAQATARDKNRSQKESVLFRLLEQGPEIANLMVTDLLFGGVDTTSHTVASLLFHLAKYPEKQNKLREEVFRIVPQADQIITGEMLADMKYLRACLRESLRIFPIAPLNLRGVTKDMVLGGYQIPKGTDVLMCHMMMSHDPKNYPNPKAYIPERWLRDSEQVHNAHPFTTLPFGFGPRTCLGRRFAEMEIQTLVAKVIRNFRVEHRHEGDIQYVSRTLNYVTSPLNFRLIDNA